MKKSYLGNDIIQIKTKYKRIFTLAFLIFILCSSYCLYYFQNNRDISILTSSNMTSGEDCQEYLCVSVNKLFWNPNLKNSVKEEIIENYKNHSFPRQIKFSNDLQKSNTTLTVSVYLNKHTWKQHKELFHFNYSLEKK